MTCKRSCVPIVAAGVLLLVAGKRLFPLDPGVAPGNYLHTSWTQDEGIDLPAVISLTQTSDGYLWLGTNDGLIRFDGMRFVRWASISGEKLPDNRIRYLRPSSEGSLWIGTDTGISRLDRGHIHRYPEADRWLNGRVSAMSEDDLGRLWMIGSGPNAELVVVSQDGSIHVYGAADGLPVQKARSVFSDRLRNLWIATDRDFCRWSPGAPAVCSMPPELDALTTVENTVQLVLALSRIGRNSLRPSDVNPGSGRGRNGPLLAKVMLRDRDGNLWMGTIGQGLWRLRDGRLERFTRRDGLSSDVINSLAEDREGNLWVATARGIDRFRDPKVVQLSTLNGLSSDVVTAVRPAEHGVWVGTAMGVNYVAGDRISRYLTDSGLPGAAVFSLYIDAHKRLWAGTTGGLAYLSKSRFIEVRSAEGASLVRVLAMIQGPDGDLWLVDEKRGLMAVREGVARSLAIFGLNANDISQLFVDVDGIVWFGHFGGASAGSKEAR